jgi:hypothetical protein
MIIRIEGRLSKGYPDQAGGARVKDLSRKALG